MDLKKLHRLVNLLIYSGDDSLILLGRRLESLLELGDMQKSLQILMEIEKKLNLLLATI